MGGTQPPDARRAVGGSFAEGGLRTALWILAVLITFTAMALAAMLVLAVFLLAAESLTGIVVIVVVDLVILVTLVVENRRIEQ